MTDKSLTTVLCTYSQKEEAREHIKEMLNQRLIACGHICPSGESLYLWDNELCRSHEFLVILKTHQGNLEQVCHYLEEHHPYECPCILPLKTWPQESKYQQWIRSIL